MKRNRISTKPGQAAWISGADAESSSSSPDKQGKRHKAASAGSPSPSLRDNIYVHLSQESTPTKRPAQPADPAPVSSATSGSISRNRVGPLEWTEAWQLSDESESEGFQGASPSLKDTLRDNIYVHLSQESTPEKASGLPAAVPEIGEPFCMPQMDAGRFYSDSEFSYFDSVSSSVGSSIGSSAASESELDSLQCLSEEDDLVDFSESLTSSSSSPVLATFQWNVAKEFGQVEAAHELARITLLKYEFDFSSLGMEETSHADGRRSGFHLGSAQFIDDLLAGCLDVFAIAQDPWSVHGSPVRLGSAESLLRRIYMSDLDMRISAIKELNFKQGLSEGYHEGYSRALQKYFCKKEICSSGKTSFS